MQRSLFALTGAALLVVALLAGSLMLNVGIPSVHAMGLTDAFSLMHSGTHGHMHGDGECPYLEEMPGGMMHHGMHGQMYGNGECPYQDAMPSGMMHRGSGDNQTRGNIDCPHGDGMMHRGMRGNSGHYNHSMMGNSGNCPFASRN
jgi:hypothetical protein